MKAEYNALAPVCALCVENGQSLAEKCEAGDPKTTLEGDVSDLHTKWEKLGQLFGDLLKKLTEALVQVCMSVLVMTLCCSLFRLLLVLVVYLY